MKTKSSLEPIAYSQEPRSFCFLLCAIGYVLCAISLCGCIRLSGTAGYTKVKDDEVVTKSTGFDLDSSRLVDQRGVS